MESDQKRAFLAVILSGLVLFGWQYFVVPPVGIDTEPSNTSIVNLDSPVVDKATSKSSIDKSIKSNVSKVGKVEEIKLVLDGTSVKFLSDLTSFQVENLDTELNSDELFDNQSKGNLNFSLLSSQNSKLYTVPTEINYKNPNTVELLYSNGDILTVSILDSTSIRFETNFPAKLTTTINTKDERLENGQVRLLKVFSESVDEYDLSDNEFFDFKTQWFGVDFNYHLLALSYDEKLNIGYKVNISEDRKATVQARSANFSPVKLNIVFAKKNYDDLIKIGRNLDKSVDFGILGLLAVPILRGLQFFYNVFPNYGVSIIILTILIRLITFPLQYKSFKSMKKMSLLQPEINKLKEKFKDDPQRLQKETMELFKRSGANPLGGCLPMLLQMPVFFAFYKVLYAAVELVGQPFYFWINDLSEKDPYFVLPVILTAAMFFQQKLTPTTSTDPTQQKVMMFMPIIFGFIMKDMPSGLVLYICVSTIFQMAQQVFVNKAA